MFSVSTFPGSTLETFDFDVSSLGYRAIGPGQTFGLVNVTYTVAPGAAPGMGALSFGSDTSFADQNGNNITDFALQNGSFTVTSASVPEPSGALLLTVGVLAMAWHRMRKSRVP